MKKISFAVLVCAAQLASFAQTSPNALPSSTLNPRKKYIAYGWEFRNLKPAEILAHADRFASLPIDGVGIVVSATNAAGRRFTQIAATDYPAWEWEAFADQVPILKALVAKPHLEESFLAGYRAPLHRAAWTDDAAWACIENNMGVIARLAHEANVKGITIDHEDYRAQRQYFRAESDPPYDECCRLARARGRQVFGRVWREHPTAILLSFWVLTETRPYFATRNPAALMRQREDLWPSFVAGILDALPPTGRLIEGDEHGYRHEYFTRDYHAAYVNAHHWGAMLLPEDVRTKHAARIEQSFGQYIDYFLEPYAPGKRALWKTDPHIMPPVEHFRRNLQDATDLSSEYVWLWGQKHSWIRWNEKSRNNPGVKYEKTWDEALPGLMEVLATVKGGEEAERGRLQRLLAAGLVTNALAGLHMNTWQPASDGRGHAVAQGALTAKAGGEYECTGAYNGCFYCYRRGIKPGERWCVRVRVKGKGIVASLSWGDDDGMCFRMPTAELVFGTPDADGWREGLAFLSVPEGVNHFKFAFGATRQKPGEKAQFRDVAAYRLWP